MPVDDILLQNKIDALNAKYEEINNTKIDIKDVLENLTSIKKTETQVKDTDANGRPIRRTEFADPFDKSLGVKMTVQRRQEIYDACILKADQLLTTA